MVDWKRTRLEFTPETYGHIEKHGVRWFEVEEIFNHEFIPLRYVTMGNPLCCAWRVVWKDSNGYRCAISG